MAHSSPDRHNQEDQEPVENDQQPATESKLLEVNFNDLQKQTVEVVEDDVTLVKKFFQEKLEKVKKDQETTRDEREEKHTLLRSLLATLIAKKNHWENLGKTANELEPFEGLIREVKKMITALERKLALIDDVRRGITRRLRSVEEIEGEQRKGVIEKIIKVIADAPTRLKDRGVHESDLRDLMEEAKNEINKVDLEKLREEYEEILDVRREDASPRILHFRLISLLAKLAAIPESEELLEKVRELKSEVDAEVVAQDERDKIKDKEARQGSVRALVHFRNVLLDSKKDREKNIVEGIKQLKQEIFDEDLNPRKDRIAILREQLEGTKDGTFRNIMLDWLLKNPRRELIPENMDEIMKDPEGGEEEEDSATPEELNNEFIEQRKQIMELQPDPDKKLYQIGELVKKVRLANARDSDFADQNGNALLSRVLEDWKRCKDRYIEIQEKSGKANSDDSRAIIERLRNANCPESLNLEDSSVIAQLVEELGESDQNQSQEPIENTDIERANADRESEPLKKNISRRIYWVSTAVIAVLVGVWVSKDSKKTEREGDNIAGVISPTPTIIQDPELKHEPSIAEQADQALRVLEERRSIYERDFSEVRHLHTRGEKISRLKELLAALAADPDGEFFDSLHDRLIRLQQQYEEEEQNERLAIRRTQLEQQFREIQELQNAIEKKAALENLATELSSESLPGFPDLQNRIAEEIQRIEKLLLRAEREAEFERRLSDIEELSSDEEKRQGIIALESDLMPQTPQTEPEFPGLLERARQVKKETEQRLEMAAQRAQFAQRLEQASSLTTDEEKKAALEELITELTRAEGSGDLLRRAQGELREVETKLSATPVSPEISPVQEERPVLSGPSMADQLQQDRSGLSLRMSSVTARISQVEAEIQRWRNHLVIEDAGRRQSVLQEKGVELSRLQSELQAYQQRDVMLSRVLSFETKNQQLDRYLELEQHILPTREAELRQIQSQVLRLERIRVRTPGENASLRQQKELELRQQADIQLLRDEISLIGRRVVEQRVD